MYRYPRYQAVSFPNLGCALDAVTADNRCVTLVSVADSAAWNINRCREYARESGFTEEQTFLDDGCRVFHWYRPA